MKREEFTAAAQGTPCAMKAELGPLALPDPLRCMFCRRLREQAGPPLSEACQLCRADALRALLEEPGGSAPITVYELMYRER